jgi:hypothetical protein
MAELQFLRCFGASLDDAWFLARRFERDAARRNMPDVRRMEWWVGRLIGGRIEAAWSTRTPLRGWVPYAGGAAAFAARRAISGLLLQRDGLWVFRDGGAPFEIEVLDAPEWIQDLAVLGDRSLLGTGFAGAPVPLDGASSPPAPPLGEYAGPIRGLGPSSMVAGDIEGRASVFDGASWSAPHSLGEAFCIADLCVRAPDDLYAATVSPSALHRYDGERWRLVAEPPAAPTSLLAHGGELLVATRDGLCRLVDDELSPIALPELTGRGAAISLWSGERVLMTARDFLADTDLTRARVLDVAELAALIGEQTPLFETAMLDHDRRSFAAPIPAETPLGDPVRLLFGSAVFSETAGDTYFLAERTEDWERAELDERESLIGRVRGGMLLEVTAHRTPITGIDRAPSGTTFVSCWSERSGLWRCVPEHPMVWERLDFPKLDGLFVLDDEHVLGWGGEARGQGFHLLERGVVRRIPAPPERVLRVHGCAPDFMVAVGHNGLIARWDGQRWHRWPSPVDGTLGSVLVLSPDEMYATGPCGAFLEGARHGWVERAPTSGAAVGIARFRSEVYVGDMVEGLLRLEGPDLVAVDLPVWPANLQATPGTLTMMESERLLWTRDLEHVSALDLDDLRVALRNSLPSFRQP